MKEQSKVIVHDYNGHCIYQRELDGYVNLTQMCRIYNKRYPDWKRQKATSEYIDKVAGSLGIPNDLVVVTTLEGPNKDRGSWGHKLVALHLAQWIDTEFALWCNQHLLELMETGITELSQEVIDVKDCNDDFWFYLEKIMELKPLLKTNKELAVQMFKHIYENL